jgi:hypothetical protein
MMDFRAAVGPRSVGSGRLGGHRRRPRPASCDKPAGATRMCRYTHARPAQRDTSARAMRVCHGMHVRGRAGHADAISSNFAALCTWWMLNAAEFGSQAQATRQTGRSAESTI